MKFQAAGVPAAFVAAAGEALEHVVRAEGRGVRAEAGSFTLPQRAAEPDEREQAHATAAHLDSPFL